MNHSPILYRTFYLLTPPSELPSLPPTLARTNNQANLHADNANMNITDIQTQTKPSYIPIHIYTVLQIAITVAIFIVTLTQAAPVFPIIIIALVPFRLLLMKRWWPREVLRFVDAWACREGTPEDEEDARVKANEGFSSDDFQDHDRDLNSGGIFAGPLEGVGNAQPNSHMSLKSQDISDERELRIAGNADSDPDWIELDIYRHGDEETGRKGQ